MRSFSKYIFSRILCKNKGFSLAEILASLIILALICSSVFVVIDRCVNSTADMTLRMQAFEIARENMEILLSRDSVKEKVDYGISNKYPHINWETSVEAFAEPTSSDMWVRAVCSAEYIDSEGLEQKVELTHWLTNISQKQMLQLLKEIEKRKEHLQEQLIYTIDEASAYADVSPEIIQMWLDNGMPTTNKGDFIKNFLDLYSITNGNPSPEEIEKVKENIELLAKSSSGAITTDPDTSGSPIGPSGASIGLDGKPVQNLRAQGATPSPSSDPGLMPQNIPPEHWEHPLFGPFLKKLYPEYNVDGN